MSKLDKPIHLGNGHTLVYVTVCLTKKAWRRALKNCSKEARAVPFPDDLHASCTHFHEPGYAAFSLITIAPHYRKDKIKMASLLAHEIVHCKQRAEDRMRTTFDHETECYYVQLLLEKAMRKIAKRLKK